MPIKIALPKGRLLARTSHLLETAGWGLNDYSARARLYRLTSARFPGLAVKMFHEKDIPIQVAVGNYDLGICSLDWVEELLAKYPSSALVRVKNLGYNRGSLYVAASREGGAAASGVTRLVSEYPNLAESFAVRQRLKRFSVFPLWGATEVYPPENADLVLIAARGEAELARHGLVPVSKVLDYGACLIANRQSWEGQDLSGVLASISGDSLVAAEPPPATGDVPVPAAPPLEKAADGAVWMALPDGHQQQPTVALLERAGITMTDYPSATGNRRPTSSLEGVRLKAIRPQDMPLQVANGSFDLAITGRDWLREHLCQFPASPIVELLDLGFGRVRIVAVVNHDLPVSDVGDLRHLSQAQTAPLRVCSEYVNIADKFARDNHLGQYRVIPSWGASEAFIPEDADLLIENTETGGTIARHNLKIIDTLFESTACLVGNRDSLSRPAKGRRMRSIVDILGAALEGS